MTTTAATMTTTKTAPTAMPTATGTTGDTEPGDEGRLVSSGIQISKGSAHE